MVLLGVNTDVLPSFTKVVIIVDKRGALSNVVSIRSLLEDMDG